MNKFKKFLSFFLVFSIIILSSTNSVSALSYGKNYKMNKGGSWTYSGSTDQSITKNWNQQKWRSVLVIQKIEFISPSTVQLITNNLAKSVGISKSKTMVKYAVDTASSIGVQKAKEKLIKKFGKDLAGKVIPYINAIGWTKTAIDILDDISLGQKLKIYSNAALKNKGIVYVQARKGSGDASKHYLWDSSSPYGSYPNAKLGPNNWQKGSILIKK